MYLPFRRIRRPLHAPEDPEPPLPGGEDAGCPPSVPSVLGNMRPHDIKTHDDSNTTPEPVLGPVEHPSSDLPQTYQQEMNSVAQPPTAPQPSTLGFEPQAMNAEILDALLQSGSVRRMDPDLLHTLSSGEDPNPSSATPPQDIFGKICIARNPPIDANSSDAANSQARFDETPRPEQQAISPDEVISRGTPLVGTLLALGIKVVDPELYGRNLRVAWGVDQRPVEPLIKFNTGDHGNQFRVLFLPQPIQISLSISSKIKIYVQVDGLPQELTVFTVTAFCGVGQLLGKLPIPGKGILFHTMFAIQFPNAPQRIESPLDFVAEKFTRLAATLANANLVNQPHIAPLWLSVGILIQAACVDAGNSSTDAVNHVLIDALVSLFEAAAAFFVHGNPLWKPSIAQSVGEYAAVAIGTIVKSAGEYASVSVGMLEDDGTPEALGRCRQALDATRLCILRLSQLYTSSVAHTPSAPEMTLIYDIPLDYLRDAIFDITPSATPQRIRFVDCRQLIDHGRLCILELEDYGAISQVPYSAVSYVWRSNFRQENPEAPPTGSRGAFKVKNVELDGDPISIDILLYAAKVSLDRGLPLTWVDRLCIIQKEANKRDKPWQLERMHDLYQGCGRCIILPDGLFVVVPPEQHTPWLERMWTMEEGLLPEDTQLLFAWKRGPGVLVKINQHVPELSGAVIGYIEEVNDETGMISLISLLQFSGHVAFIDSFGERHVDIKFNLFEGDGLVAFSTAAALFRVQEPPPPLDLDHPDPTRPIRHSRECSPRDVSLWYSAFVRDATYRDDIILILARLLGLEKREATTETGLRQYKMTVRQKITLGEAIKFAEVPTKVPLRKSQHSRWNMLRIMYDLFYAFDVGTFSKPDIIPPYNTPYTTPPPLRPEEQPPSYDGTLSLSSLSQKAANISLDTLSLLLEISPDSCRSLESIAIRGDVPGERDHDNQLSIKTLTRILTLLPNIRCLSLSALTIVADPGPSAYSPPYTLQHVELEDLRASTSSSRDFAALLSLIDVEYLRIHAPLSLPDGPTTTQSRAVCSTSSQASDALTTRPEFPDVGSPIHGVRSLYMNCGATESVSWLSALMEAGHQRGNAPTDDIGHDEQDLGTLRKVDVICQDIRAAFVVGDFLRGTGASSVDHLVLDFAQLCRYRPPFRFGHPVQALMHDYPHHLRDLTIRLQYPMVDMVAANKIGVVKGAPVDQVIPLMISAHYTCIIRILLGTARSPPKKIDSFNLEIDIGDDTSLTLETILGALATYYNAETLRGFLDNGWPQFSKTVNFVWRRPAQAHENCPIDAEQLLVGVFRALQTHQQDTARLRDVEVVELTDWCKDLLAKGIVTSRWEPY